MHERGPDFVDELQAEVKLLQAARELLTPMLAAVEEACPGAVDAAILVTIPVGSARCPVVIATDRRRVAFDLMHYVSTVLSEAPHDRGSSR